MLLLVQGLLNRALAPGVEQIRGAADVLAADEDLRNRDRAGALGEHGANLAAQLARLVRHRVEIDAAILDAQLSRTACAPTSRTRTTRARTSPPARCGSRHPRAFPPRRRARPRRARLPARWRGGRRVEAEPRRRARDLQLLRVHVLADVLEQRRRQVALAGVGQHADDVRARLGALRDRRAPRPAWRHSRCRRRCLPGAPARAPCAARHCPPPARSRRSVRRSRRLR